ncbi:MAG: ABC transporter ATP-binding protein [Dehalococcoidia bacterium]|nr:MAG: ABC transporter ATP-binding protein [Dehalococcoidia bacterium]
MIHLEGIEKVYRTDAGEVRALDGVSLDVRAGEFIAIMGASGSGKSTMMNIIGLLDDPTAGIYELDGADVSKLDDDTRSRLRGRLFGFVFQSYNLVPRMTAVEQVELPLLYQRRSNRRAMALEALERVGLADRASHHPNQLSGGQQQRVAIARSLVVHPNVILADEPTGALDTRTSEEVMGIFEELAREQQITVVVVTHEQNIADFTNRTVRMRDGVIISDEQRARATAPASTTPVVSEVAR